uniref:DUF4220 domain-containing protein n=1 Tax=Oryza barthii TaxID=65489 RepID=A0A0D3HB42_9ORYZ
MGLSSAIDWWEECQRRILVLSSMGIQVFLFFSAMMRKCDILSWFRSIVWLAYLGSDAMAIYAMAALFNRHKNQNYTKSFKVQGNNSLEVLWAPILLIHLGGQDVITAYNIEDNELWRRQVLTTVSQVTVSVYVFCKSWQLDIIHSDLRMMLAVMQMFVFGVLKCIEKPNIFRNNPPWSYKVSQCRLIGNYVGSSIKPCDSSGSITELVLQHVKSGWKDYITNVASYRMFNDNRGQWSLQHNNCDNEDLAWSLRVPFDESVLLWYLATDLCLLSEGYTNEGATRSIEISNYMMYLLLNNPDMLMVGTRRSLFTTAIHELEGIIGDETLNDIDLAHKIIAKVESSEGHPSFIHNACALSKALLRLDNTKMWEVIEGVWVEMLCFSASRCRGYLHAKSLGNGGELLTFVWLLLLRMGMEPLAEKLQRAEIPKGGGNGAASAASLSSDQSLALQQKKTEVPSGDEGNIADVPSTSNDSIVIDIGDNAS